MKEVLEMLYLRYLKTAPKTRPGKSKATTSGLVTNKPGTSTLLGAALLAAVHFGMAQQAYAETHLAETPFYQQLQQPGGTDFSQPG